MTATGPEERPSGGNLAAAISRELVRLLSEYTGRGPTKARTYLNEDLVSVVLRDTLTKAERLLAANGHAEHVHHTRTLMQNTMREDIIAAVERLTDRKVIAFLSDNHVDPDIAVESLVLEPADGGRGEQS